MKNTKFNFDENLVEMLQNLDGIPLTEPGDFPGTPGRLFVISPELIPELNHIITTLDNVSFSDFQKYSDEEKWFFSTLLNNAERVLVNSAANQTIVV